MPKLNCFLNEQVRESDYRKWFLMVYDCDIYPKLPKSGPENEKIIESVQ